MEEILTFEKIEIPLFHGHFELYKDQTMEVMLKDVQAKHGKINFPDLTNALGFSAVTSSGVCIILINTRMRAASEPTMAKTINHEALHLSWYILDALGIELTVNNHEIQAYLLEFIIDRIS